MSLTPMNRARGYIRLGLVCTCLLLSIHSAAQPAPGTQDFVVFDSMRFTNKPNLEKYGITPIRIIYAAQIWAHKSEMAEPPSEAALSDISQSIVRTRHRWGDLVVLDVEHWKLRGKAPDVERNIQRYGRLVDAFRKLAPGVRFGFYGTFPIVDFYRASRPGTRLQAAWMEENRRVAELTERLDALFPSLYARSDDINAWIRYAEAQLREARRYADDKPVYAFLMPQYHPAAGMPPEALIAHQFWREQLATCARHADGIVLWGGKNLTNREPMRWDDEAQWWEVTKQFLQNY